MQSLEDISIQYVKGVGPARKKIFQQLGVESIEDLLYFFPRRYEDRRHLVPVAQARVGEWQTVSGKILAKSSRRSWYTKKHVSEMTLDDGSGRISCIWFNQPYLERYFIEGKRVVCYGKVDVYKSRLQMVSPEHEILESEEDESLSLKRIVPIYPLTRGVTQRYLRKTIKSCLEKYQGQLRERLPAALRDKYRLADIARSMAALHFPEDFESQEKALERVSFEEFYFFQISVILRRLSVTRKPGVAHRVSDALASRFIDAFPFELTGAQKKAVREIRADMSRAAPMLRLLQGDVGSGKTLVALFGCLAAYENGYQSCVMAPTEILARQHYENISGLVSSGPFKDVKTALLVSGLKKSEREDLNARIKNGDVDLVVGTHALINEEVCFKNLSFAVIDEQHKFGVRQRALLAEKGNNPDVLIMTATPIPRTLCITLYGDLDVSVLDELPAGRGRVETRLYSLSEARDVYALVRDKVAQGRQVYVVYPVIEESETLDLKAATEMFKRFEAEDFKGLRVGLVHGRMKPKDNRDIMDRFKNKELDILVATTVVEVGVDVSNAGVMVIEHAERFGLAQLHQLRGRVGRGQTDGLCVLIADAETEESQARIKAILSTTDGFEIAQRDLEIRGPGRFFGRHQHGLNELKVANPLTQLNILESARKEAVTLTGDDPKLEKGPNRYIKEVIIKRYPTYLRDAGAG
jgi:ATP-dependent DNA helicase RecG